MPLGTTGAAYHGGRWNRPGHGALYLSEEFAAPLPVATAWAEFQQDVGIRVGTLVPYEADLANVVDLTDATTVAALALNVGDFSCHWKGILTGGGVPPTWPIVDDLLANGAHALRVPSVAHPGGINLVVYKLDGSAGQVVRAIDPQSALPVSQASWPSMIGP